MSSRRGGRSGSVSSKRAVELKRLVREGNSFALDTSAILAYLHGERGGKLVALVAGSCSIPFMALTELYYITWQKTGKATADAMYGLVKSWGMPVLMPEERIILTAGRFKVLHGLGIADSYIAAAAFVTGSILLARDPDYDILEDDVRVFQLTSR